MWKRKPKPPKVRRELSVEIARLRDELGWSECDFDGTIRESIAPPNVDWSDKESGDFTYLCPDDRRADFEYGAYCIAKSVQFDALPNRNSPAPSKVKRELEHLDDVLSKLSPEAQARLGDDYRSKEFFRRFVKLVQQLDDVPKLFSSDASVRSSAASKLPPSVTANDALMQQTDDAFDRLPPEAMQQLDEVSSPAMPWVYWPVDRWRKLIRRASGDTGQSKRGPDLVRKNLGKNASAIWAAHGGDVIDDEFMDFVDKLIESSGLDSADDDKGRVSLETLVREARKNVAEHGPPAWRLW